MTDAVRSYSELLRRVLGNRVTAKARSFLEMVAPDGVVEFPFALPGMSKRLVGRDALAQHLAIVGGRVAFDRMSEPLIHHTADPEVLIVEFEGFGRGIKTGEPYEQRYIAVIRTRGGYIVHIKEYWDPLEVLRTLKNPAIVDTLASGVWSRDA